MLESTTAPPVAHQFETREQQERTASLGMWVFLLTELLFFGGMFVLYAAYRAMFGDSFAAASQHLDVVLGTVNTAVLIVSSFTVAMAVHVAKDQQKRVSLRAYLISTIFLGAVFLCIKGYEYYHKWQENLVPGRGFSLPAVPRGEVYFSLYFVMTSIHALHLLIGMGIMVVFLGATFKRSFVGAGVHVAGLYWHFVDLVWIFLFPLLYLIGRHT